MSTTIERRKLEPWWRSIGGTGDFDGDVPMKHTFDHKYQEGFIPTLAREAFQNILDAKQKDTPDPACGTVRVKKLEGDDLREFLDAIGWNDGLEEHLEQLARQNDRIEHSLRLDGVLDDLDPIDEAELLVAVIEDFNTVGLYGGEQDNEKPYKALVTNRNASTKGDEQSAGSHGIGSEVLWSASSIATTIFYSQMSEESDRPGDRRLIGRMKHPDLETDGQIKKGKGRLGKDSYDEEIDEKVSVWNDEADEIASRLGLDQREEPGTSIVIPGFCSPVGDLHPDPDEIVEKFRHAAERYFWPAIWRGELQLEIGQGELEEVTVDDDSPVHPFVECLEGRADPDDELQSPGDVATTSYPVEFEKKGEDPFKAKVEVSARKVYTSGPDDEYLNEVALMRGSGMVVRYESYDSIAQRGHDFNGVLTAGRARSWGNPEAEVTDEDKLLEAVLEDAEPAAHDTWDNTNKLTDNWGGDRVTEVRRLRKSALEDAIKGLVEINPERSGKRIDALSEILDYDDTVETSSGDDDDDDTPVEPTFGIGHHGEDLSLSDDGRQWEFETTVERPAGESGEYSAAVSIAKLSNDNSKAGYYDVDPDSTNEAESASIEVEEIGSSDSRRQALVVTFPDGVDEVQVSGKSDELLSTNPRTGLFGAATLSYTELDREEGGEEA